MARAKKDAKKLKDLDPKAKGKGVKGGRNYLGRDVNRIMSRDVPRIGDNVEDLTHDVAKAIRKTVNPR
jgi:hypothetical protein